MPDQNDPNEYTHQGEIEFFVLVGRGHVQIYVSFLLQFTSKLCRHFKRWDCSLKVFHTNISKFSMVSLNIRQTLFDIGFCKKGMNSSAIAFNREAANIW